MDSAEPQELPKTGPTVTGPIIVGVTLNWWLYGILVMQYYIYLGHASRDKKFLRWIVHFLFALDTAQTILTMCDAFYWFVYNFGDYSKLYNLNFAGLNSPLMDAIIAFVVQMVYCWRVWVLGKWRVIPAIAALLAFISCVNGVLIGVHDMMVGTVFKIKPVFRIADYLWLFCSAMADVVIATSMAYLLLKFKSKHATSQTTGSTIKRILVFTLETNALTALLAITIILFFLIKPIAPPNTNVYLAGGYLIGKLYNNCFMVLLNQRLAYESPMRSQHTNTTDDIGTFNDVRSRSQYTSAVNPTRSHAPHPNHVEVEVSVIQFSDPKTDPKLNSSETLEMSDLGRGGKTGQDFV